MIVSQIQQLQIAAELVEKIEKQKHFLTDCIETGRLGMHVRETEKFSGWEIVHPSLTIQNSVSQYESLCRRYVRLLRWLRSKGEPIEGVTINPILAVVQVFWKSGKIENHILPEFSEEELPEVERNIEKYISQHNVIDAGLFRIPHFKERLNVSSFKPIYPPKEQTSKTPLEIPEFHKEPSKKQRPGRKGDIRKMLEGRRSKNKSFKPGPNNYRELLKELKIPDAISQKEFEKICLTIQRTQRRILATEKNGQR